MRQQHVEVALVHGDVGGLADRAAGMVQPFRHVAELHELAEILHRRIAPPAGRVAHEGGAVDRRADQVAPADQHRFLGVAGRLGELAGRGGAELARKPAGDAHALALDLGAGLAPQLQRPGVVDEIHPDLGQHRFGVGLDGLQRLGVQHLEIGNVALDILCGLDAQRAAFRPPCRTAARAARPAPCRCLCHVASSPCFGCPAPRLPQPGPGTVAVSGAWRRKTT